jgi:hypothetical protein
MLYQRIPSHIFKVIAVVALACLGLGTLAKEAKAWDPMGSGVEILIFDDDQVTLEQVDDKDDVIESCPYATTEVRLRQGDTARLYVAASLKESGCQLFLTNRSSVDVQYTVDGTRWRAFPADETITFSIDPAPLIDFLPDAAPWPTEGLTVVYAFN